MFKTNDSTEKIAEDRMMEEDLLCALFLDEAGSPTLYTLNDATIRIRMVLYHSLTAYDAESRQKYSDGYKPFRINYHDANNSAPPKPQFDII